MDEQHRQLTCGESIRNTADYCAASQPGRARLTDGTPNTRTTPSGYRAEETKSRTTQYGSLVVQALRGRSGIANWAPLPWSRMEVSCRNPTPPTPQHCCRQHDTPKCRDMRLKSVDEFVKHIAISTRRIARIELVFEHTSLINWVSHGGDTNSSKYEVVKNYTLRDVMLVDMEGSPTPTTKLERDRRHPLRRSSVLENTCDAPPRPASESLAFEK